MRRAEVLSLPPMADLPDTRWLGTTEAAERLGIVPRTLYRLINEGKIPAYKFGRVIRVTEADLATYLEENRVQPGSIAHLYPDTDPDRDRD